MNTILNLLHLKWTISYLDIVYLRSAQYLTTSCEWLGVECYLSVSCEANVYSIL